MSKPKLIRITTVPISLKILLKGQHRFMSSHFEVIGVSSSGTDLQAVEQEENIRVVSIEMTRTISPLKDLKSLWQLYRLFKREKPLIVHSHTPKAGTLSMIAAKLAGVPNRLHTIAGLPLLEAKGAKRILLDTVEKITYSCASMIYPNSHGLQDIIIANKYTKESKLKVIANGSSNGIDTNYFNPVLYSEIENQELRTKLNIEATDFVFVFVGRLVGDKGINELVEAFKRFENGELRIENYKLEIEKKEIKESGEKELRAGCKLLLVGPSETELDPLKPETLAALENNKNIITVGWQKDVRPYLAISDALAFPSYREGFPNVVMQAGAMGLPVIVSDINGCNEIIEDRVNGLIVPTKDAVALEYAMFEIISDKTLYAKLKTNAREMIVSRYEQRVVWEALVEEYMRLTSSTNLH